MTDDNFTLTNYLYLPRTSCLRYETTSFLQQHNVAVNLKCENLNSAAQSLFRNFVPRMITPPLLKKYKDSTVQSSKIHRYPPTLAQA